MTTIEVDPTRMPAPIGDTALASNLTIETAWAFDELVEGTSEYRTTATSKWVIPSGGGSFEAAPVDGATNALKIRVTSGVPNRPEWFVLVPESGSFNLADLERIDPSDLSPIGPPTPAFRSALDAEAAAREAADELLQFNIDNGVSPVTDAGMAAVAESGGEFTAALTAQIRAGVQDAVLTRDGSGRIASALEDGQTVTYTRDSAGRIETMTRAGKVTTYVRDGLGRIVSWSTEEA